MFDDLMHALLIIIGFGVMFFLFILYEVHYFRSRNQKDVYHLKETLSNIALAVMYKVTDGAAVALFSFYFYDWFKRHGLDFAPNNPIVALIFLFFVVELTFWFYHFFMHKVRWGWASHSVHHSSERYNFSTALRQNFLVDLSGVQYLLWVPAALIGFDKFSIIVMIEFSLFYQFFIHTQMVKRLPAWFEFVFNTPSHHRVHHGRNPGQLDRNFGGVLIVFDRLFGTFRDESEAGVIRYGIATRPPKTLNPFLLSVTEFCLMWRDVVVHKDLRILWKSPDWVDVKYPKNMPSSKIRFKSKR